MIRVICKNCKLEFSVFKYRKETARFCSRSCSGKSRVGSRNSFFGKVHSLETRAIMKLLKIGKTLSESHKNKIRESHLGEKSHLWRGGKITKLCENENCDKKFTTYPSRAKVGKGRYCSRECEFRSQNFLEKHSREKSAFWLGGRMALLPLKRQIRGLKEYRTWREAIFARDNYTCQICNKRGYKLAADHIRQFSLILVEKDIKTLEDATNCQELWDTNNGRTLCEPCHTKTDTFGGGAVKTLLNYNLVSQYA